MFKDLKNIYQKIVKLFKWIPVIWYQTPEYDYSSIVNLMRFQFERMSEFFYSEKTHVLNAKQKGKRINTIKKLIDKVYDEDYKDEYHNFLKQKYGEYTSVFVPSNKIEVFYNNILTKDLLEKIFKENIHFTHEIINYGKDASKDYLLLTIFKNYDYNFNENLLSNFNEDLKKELIKSTKKQNKAHRILWKLIEHNIRSFWD